MTCTYEIRAKSIPVEEIQSLYGPISISERVIQKIWLKQDFATHSLQTISGKSLKVIHPGKWNLNEGPDFLDATLEIDGEKKCGDVEVHFYPKDWELHQHTDNPNFSRVVLHIVLFGNQKNHTEVTTSSGYSPETVSLLKYLDKDLEQHASEQALLALENRDYWSWVEELLEKDLDTRRQELIERATTRWAQKCIFAQSRVDKHGWDDACHQLCLEVLGYRRNRGPMHQLSIVHPLKEFESSGLSATTLFNSVGSWKTRGVRPANQPKKRLEQYISLVKNNPSWTTDVRNILTQLPSTAMDISRDKTGHFRKHMGMKKLRTRLETEVFGNNISGTRLDTLIIDALLPLADTQTDQNLLPHWFHWYGGDCPEKFPEILKQCKITNKTNYPTCNGYNQGLLQIFFEEGF